MTTALRSQILAIIASLLPKRKKHTSKIRRQGGAIPSPKDIRDNFYLADPVSGGIFSSTNATKAFTLRGSPFLSRVEDQGAYSSCVATAGCTLLETLQRSHGSTNFPELSKMDAWNKARKLSQTFPENKGVYIRDFWKVAKDTSAAGGISVEATFPYQDAYFNKEPTFASTIFRHLYSDFNYVWVQPMLFDNRASMIKEALINHKVPVLFSLPIQQQFFTIGNDTYTIKKGASTLFFHAMLIVGFDDEKKTYEVMNSWGTGWGDQGFCRIDQQSIMNYSVDMSYAKPVK